jgi:hypothetical protein
MTQNQTFNQNNNINSNNNGNRERYRFPSLFGHFRFGKSVFPRALAGNRARYPSRRPDQGGRKARFCVTAEPRLPPCEGGSFYVTKVGEGRTENQVHLVNRLALRPKEAAAALGVSERAMRHFADTEAPQ